MEKDIYKCISCGIVDDKVECGGIYYCPNPFCTVSGATNWKTNNLMTKETSSGIELLSYEGWLEKGMATINGYSKELREKILASNKTKERIEMLEHKETWDEEDNED